MSSDYAGTRACARLCSRAPAHACAHARAAPMGMRACASNAEPRHRLTPLRRVRHPSCTPVITGSSNCKCPLRSCTCTGSSCGHPVQVRASPRALPSSSIVYDHIGCTRQLRSSSSTSVKSSVPTRSSVAATRTCSSANACRASKVSQHSGRPHRSSPPHRGFGDITRTLLLCPRPHWSTHPLRPPVACPPIPAGWRT